MTMGDAVRSLRHPIIDGMCKFGVVHIARGSELVQGNG